MGENSWSRPLKRIICPLFSFSVPKSWKVVEGSGNLLLPKASLDSFSENRGRHVTLWTTKNTGVNQDSKPVMLGPEEMATPTTAGCFDAVVTWPLGDWRLEPAGWAPTVGRGYLLSPFFPGWREVRGPLSLLEFLTPISYRGREAVLCGASPARYTRVSFFLSSLLWLSCQLVWLQSLDCSLPGSSVHGIFQLRILEWVAVSFSRGSTWSDSGIEPRSPAFQVAFCTAGRFFTEWATGFVCLFIWLWKTFSCSMWDLVPRPGIKPGPPALGV